MQKKKRKVKEFTAHCQVIQYKLAYNDLRKFKSQFEAIKNDNEGEFIEVKYKVIDKAAHYMHKYYRGAVLPILTQSKDVKEESKMHTHLKNEFLYMEIPSGKWTDIPIRYLTNAKIAAVEEDKLNSTYIPSGSTIIVLQKEQIIGVIPSHAVITQKEFYDFIKKCENIMYDMIDNFEIPPEMLELKDLAWEVMNKHKEQRENSLENQLKLEFAGEEVR